MADVDEVSKDRVLNDVDQTKQPTKIQSSMMPLISPANYGSFTANSAPFEPANSPAMHFSSYGFSTNGGISPATNLLQPSSFNHIYGNGYMITPGNYSGGIATNRYLNDSPAGFSNRFLHQPSLGGICLSEPRSEGADKDYVYQATPNFQLNTLRQMNLKGTTADNNGGWNLDHVPDAQPFVAASPNEILVSESENDDGLEEGGRREDDIKAASPSGNYCSVGSAGHPLTCRPCAFFWTKGCMNGKDCRFCHEWHPPKKKKPMKEQKNLMIIARPDGRIEFMRCTVQEALGVL